MNKRKIILGCYALTALAVLVYYLYLAFQLDVSSAIWAVLPVLVLCALLVWAESLLFLLLFAGSFREVRSLLLPVFVVSSVAPGWVLSTWFNDRPAPIPAPGPLPVKEVEYAGDKEAIANDFVTKDVGVWSERMRVDSIYNVRVDTIIYSKDLKRFFAFVFVSVLSENKNWYFTEYRVGSRVGEVWVLARPKGNIWSTQFESPDSIRIQLLQYYYNRYSINGSDPDKPEIWTDSYIFPSVSREG